MSGLTKFQQEVARVFFALDESREFVLSGGAALITHDMISRSTGDLDLFSVGSRQLDEVVAALTREAAARGWSFRVVRQSSTFVRIEVGDIESGGLVVDLGDDSAPLMTLTETTVGPTYQPIELAARKLLALFGRAEARDFCDMYELNELFDLGELCELAGRIDPGFTLAGLAEALGAVDRFADVDFPKGSRSPEIRSFARAWKNEIESSP